MDTIIARASKGVNGSMEKRKMLVKNQGDV
jgi:hypothetical protein